ncbi:MAG: MATE family efflux transporter [Clostridia bacterium]|nr:MATE family efflux transporter [Clostridia bacterium]
MKTITRKSTGHYQMDMTTGAILPKMLAFSLPLMLSSILQLMFNAADIIVVGQFCGDASLAAVSSNGSLVNLLTGLFMGLSVGSNVLAARFFGSKSDEELSQTVHTSILISIIAGVFLTFVGLIGARQLLIWMQTPDNVLELASVYLRIYFVGMTSTTVYNFGAALLRAIGDTKRPLYYLIIAGVLNVVLNLFFVIVFHMDVAGVALATIISQTLSALLVVRCLLRESGGIRLDPKKLCINKAKLIQIVRVGVPAGLQGTLFSLSNVVIQSSINLFGDIVVAGNGAAANLEGFVYVAMNAFYQATLSFTSQNLGQHKYKRIIRTMLVGQACVFVTGLVLGNLLYLAGDKLLWIYSDTQQVVEAGMLRLGFVATTYFLCGMMDVMMGGLRGIGYSFLPMIVSLIGACGLRLVWIATIFQVPEFHIIETIYISYPISWLVTFLVHLTCYIILTRRLRKRLGDEIAD